MEARVKIELPKIVARVRMFSEYFGIFRYSNHKSFNTCIYSLFIDRNPKIAVTGKKLSI